MNKVRFGRAYLLLPLRHGTADKLLIVPSSPSLYPYVADGRGNPLCCLLVSQK